MRTKTFNSAVMAMAVGLFALIVLPQSASAGASPSQPLDLRADGTHSCESIDAGSLKRRAASGNVRAQFMLGKLFEHGMCVEPDELSALKWFRQAAKNGHVEASVQVALYLIERDIETDAALAHLQRAAAHDHALAQHMLGLALLSPSASLSNRHQGLFWLGSAVTLGSGFSAITLGMLHERGLRGVPKNPCLALDWYEAGQLIGYEQSRAHFRRLSSKLGDSC